MQLREEREIWQSAASSFWVQDAAQAHSREALVLLFRVGKGTAGARGWRPQGRGERRLAVLGLWTFLVPCCARTSLRTFLTFVGVCRAMPRAIRAATTREHPPSTFSRLAATAQVSTPPLSHSISCELQVECIKHEDPASRCFR